VRTPAALTSVAGTAVLGTRLTVLGWDWAGVALLVIAFLLWAALLAPVLAHWRTPHRRRSLVLTVSTESLAVLAATLAIADQAHWLLVAAIGRSGSDSRSMCSSSPALTYPARHRSWRPLDHRRRARDLDLAAGKITTGAKALAVLGVLAGRSRACRSAYGR